MKKVLCDVVKGTFAHCCEISYDFKTYNCRFEQPLCFSNNFYKV